MIFSDVLIEILRRYPDAQIKTIPRGAKYPSEFIVVPEPTENHPEWSMGVSYVQSSRRHYHEKTRELYVVEQGEIDLFIGSESLVLGPGNWHEVPENTVHWVCATLKCAYAIVRIYSNPGWTLQDHHLVLVPK